VHLAALVDSPDHVCCRYRLAAFAASFAQAGHLLAIHSLPRSLGGWFRLRTETRGCHAVILQRRLLSAWQLSLVRRAAPLFYFDFDDAVFWRDSYAMRGHESPRRGRRFEATVRAADVVIAGNTFLAEQASAVVGGGPVRVIPTCVDVRQYPEALHRRAGQGVQLAWIGSSSTLQGLERARALFEILGRHNPGIGLTMICDQFASFRHLPVRGVPWSPATEAGALAACDIGVSWVPDDRWSQGKCGLKLLQYMAAGLPVVANPVGVQANMVRHGQTGLLAQTPGEWCSAVAQLAADPELRRRMGAAGRALVENEYSVEVGASRWLTLLSQAAWRRTTA
jgi:glycosyltransferase involved in cell wall biosynthesis